MHNTTTTTNNLRIFFIHQQRGKLANYSGRVPSRALVRSASRSLMEARLATLEAKLGLVPGKVISQGDGVEQRLAAMKMLYESTMDPGIHEIVADSN